MARNVGSIEVTVDANTGRLKAQMVQDGKAGAKAAVKAINAELKKIEAEIGAIDGRKEAQLLRAQIEKALRDIPATVDVDLQAASLAQMSGEMKEWREKEESNQVALKLQLGEASVKETAARIHRMTDEQREVTLDLVGDATELRAELARLEAQDRDLKFIADLDAKFLEAETKRIESQRRNARFIAQLDFKQATLDLERAEAVWERNRIAMPVLADTESFDRSIMELRVKMAAASTDVKVLADTKEAYAQLKAFEKNQMRIPVDGDLKQIRAALTLYRQMQENDAIEVPLDIDDKGIDNALRRMESKAKASGEKSGEDYSRGMSMRMKAILVGVVALAEPAANAIQGLLAASISILSSAFSAMASAGGAAMGMFAALGASVGTLVVGFQGMGTALGAIKDEFGLAAAEGRQFNMEAEDIVKAMGALSPAARKVAQAFAEVYPQLSAIRKIVQERLFEGLDESLRDMASSTLPGLSQGLRNVAQSFNRFFKDLAVTVGEIDFARIFASLQPAIDSVQSAFLALARTIQPFLLAAAPATRALAESFRLAAESLSAMVLSGAQTGKLQSFLMAGVESLREWWTLVRNVGDAMATLFAASKGEGDSFIRSLSTMVKRWDDWMESIEGQRALQQFFATGKEVMDDLKPVLKGLQGFFDNLISDTAMNRFGDFADAVGNVLPVLGSMLEIVGRMQLLNTFAALLSAVADALEPIIPDLQALADAIGEALTSGLRASIPLLTTMASSLGFLAQALTPVVETFDNLPDSIQAVIMAMAAFKFLGGNFSGLVSGLGSVRDQTLLLGTAMGDVGRSISGGVKNIAANFGLLGPAAQAASTSIAGGFKGLGPALGQVAKSAGAAAGTVIAGAMGIAFGVQMAMEADNMGQQVMGLMTIIGSAAAAFATGGPIVGAITLATGAITAFFQHSANEAKKAKAEVDEYVNALGGVGAEADKLKAVGVVLENLTKEQEQTRKAFTDMGFAVGDWADGVVEGTDTAKSGIMEFASSFGPAGREIADALRTGKMGVDEFVDGMETLTGNVNGVDLTALRQEMYDAGLSATATGDTFDFLRDEAGELGKASDELSQRAKEAGSALEVTGDGAEAAVPGMENLNSASEDTLDALFKLDQGMADLQDRMGDIDFGAINVAPTGIQDAANDYRDLASAAGEAADSAKSMTSAFDLLVGRNISTAEALADVHESIDSMNEVMADGEAVTGQYADSFDVASEAGRKTQDALLAGVEAIGAWGESAIAGGMATQDAAAYMNAMTESLISTSSQFFASEGEARKFIETLGLTPENITTMVNTPGLLEASVQILDYDRDIDGIPDKRDTEFTAPTIQQVRDQLALLGVDMAGIDDTVVEAMFITPNLPEAQSAVETFGGTVEEVQTDAATNVSAPGAEAASGLISDLNTETDTLDGKVVNPTIQATTAPGVQRQLDTLETTLNDVNRMRVVPIVTMPSLAPLQTKVDTLARSLRTLPDATSTVTVNGVTAAITNVQTLDRAIRNLSNKTITVTTNQKTVQSMAGRVVGGPTLTTVGERGYAEAIVPLQLPLNRVDPSVRHFAELLRNGGSGTVHPGTGKIVNNYMTITPTSADPGAVATQVINRSAMMANR